MRRLQTFRLIALIFMLAMGRMFAWSDTVSPSSVSEDSEIGFQFSGSEETSSIKDLPWNNGDSQTRSIAINGYVFNFYNCVKSGTNTNLQVRGDGNYNGHFSFVMNGTVSSLKIQKEQSRATGNVTVRLSKLNCTDVVITKPVSTRGEYSFDIPEAQRLQDATITISADFQFTLSKLTVVKKGGQIVENDTWIRFRNLGSKTYYSTDRSDVPEASIGQIVEIESNNKAGFNPVSTPDNEYVVVYSVHRQGATGLQPVEFSNVCDAKGNWKDGIDNYPNDSKYGENAGKAIGKIGYVYRKGVVLTSLVRGGKVADEFTPGTTVAVEVAIYKLTPDNSEPSGKKAEFVKRFEKLFKLVGGTTRPRWNDKVKDLTFSPKTLMALGNLGTTYVSGMSVIGTTEKVTTTLTDASNYMMAKFSTGDKYDPQSLFNANGITPVEGKKSSTSSAVGARRLSVLQFTHDGIASENVAEAYYYFVKRQQLKLNAVEKDTENKEIELDLSTGSSKTESTIALTATYNDGTADVALSDLTVLGLKASDITVGDNYAEIVGDITYSTDKSTAYIKVRGLSDGTTPVTIKSEKTSITSATALNYTDAATNINVTVTGSGNVITPYVTPKEQFFASTFNANVRGHKGTDTYWLLLDKSTSVNNAGVSLLSGEESAGMTAEQILSAVTGPESDLDPGTKRGYFSDANNNDIEIVAKPGANYELYAVSVDPTINDVKKGFSEVVSRVYTYTAEATPVLTPGIEGAANYYKFYDAIKVEAKASQPQGVVYYNVGTDPLTFSVDNGVVTTNGVEYNDNDKIAVGNSCVVHALVYNAATGLHSDVVTYRYVKNSDDIKDQPYFVIDDTDYYNGDIYNGGSDGKKVLIKASYYDSEDNAHEIGGDNVKWDSDKYHIFYTTDGTAPTENSFHYTGAIDVPSPEVASKIIAGVFFDEDKSMSELSTLNVFNSKLAYWETTEQNCPGGVLADRNVEIAKDGETFVNVQFGGMDTTPAWKHYISHEYATGDPIDHIGTYTIAQSDDAHEGTADVRDENGNYWNHSKANTKATGFQTHKATFGLPSKGSYVKFEPKQSGKLIIWCCQEGALYYSNAIDNDLYSSTNFNDAFLRKRPAYFVDEAGVSYEYSDLDCAGKLSSNWATDWSTSHWKKKGETQHGVKQTLYTQTQTSNIYKMFNDVITNKGAVANSTSIKDLVVKLNAKNNGDVAGFNVTDDANRKEGDTKAYTPDELYDNTGVCIPSASYMKYTFDVKAGKTYYFFGWMTKIGIRGLGFEPSAATTNEAEINSGKPANGTNTDKDGDSNANDFSGMVGKTYAKVTVNRTFKAGKWTTLVLPFSVSASQVKDVFGDNTQVLHYRTIEDRTMYFFKHYHQMIVAGTPVLVKPGKTDDIVNPEFTNVTIESTEVTDRPCNDYNNESDTNYQMVGSYKMQTYNHGDYYISSEGKVKKLSKTTAELPGTRAYIVGKDAAGEPAEVGYMARSAYNNPVPTGMDDETTGIDVINVNENATGTANGSDNSVYNLNGQQMRQGNGSLEGLEKGVYVSGGKKIIKK